MTLTLTMPTMQSQLTNTKNSVALPSSAHLRMAENWPLIRALLGGTKTMRAAGESLLPRHPAESRDDYVIRLQRAFLTNYYTATVKHLVGKAFSKPLVLQDDVPAQIVEWAEDIDLQGTHLNDFAANLFSDVISMGFASILVDYPKQILGTTLAEEREAGGRPYMSMVQAENVLGVRTAGPANKIQVARLREETIEADGEFGEKEVHRIRVLFPGGYRLYELGTNKEYVVVDEGLMSPLQEVPLIPVYGQKIAPWLGEPKLLDLAYKNIQHYQIDSDVDNALRVACFPMLAVSGWNADRDPIIKVGPNVVLATSESQGKFYYVEHSGAAIATGRQRLEDIKAEMAIMGIQMLMPQASSAVTATEAQIKYAESTSDLQRMAFGLKDAVENALVFMAKWIGLADGGSIELKGQFTLPRDAATEAQALIQLRMAGEITSTTLLSELKRRDFLPDDFDVEAERELLSLEAPSNVFGE